MANITGEATEGVRSQTLPFGIEMLDEELTGIPEGGTCLVCGGKGTGKTVLALNFLLSGLALEERVALVTSTYPEQFLDLADELQLPLRNYVETGQLILLYQKTQSAGIIRNDQDLASMLSALEEKILPWEPTRMAIDSAVPFFSLLHPGFRDEGIPALIRRILKMKLALLLTTRMPASTEAIALRRHLEERAACYFHLDEHRSPDGDSSRRLVVRKMHGLSPPYPVYNFLVENGTGLKVFNRSETPLQPPQQKAEKKTGTRTKPSTTGKRSLDFRKNLTIRKELEKKFEPGRKTSEAGDKKEETEPPEKEAGEGFAFRDKMNGDTAPEEQVHRPQNEYERPKKEEKSPVEEEIQQSEFKWPTGKEDVGQDEEEIQQQKFKWPTGKEGLSEEKSQLQLRASNGFVFRETEKDDIYKFENAGAAVEKTRPDVLQWPAASGITYGETLADAELTGGEAGVEGDFQWSDASPSPDAGDYQPFEVTFTPEDTQNYSAVSSEVPVTVLRAQPQVLRWPSASGITYGETLADAKLTGGKADVEGDFQWSEASRSPDAGEYQPFEVTFTPEDTQNYCAVSSEVPVTVLRAQPQVLQWPAASGITYGETLAESELSGGYADLPGSFAFSHESFAPDAGEYMADITFMPDDNDHYSELFGAVPVTVQKMPLEDEGELDGYSLLEYQYPETTAEGGMRGLRYEELGRAIEDKAALEDRSAEPGTGSEKPYLQGLSGLQRSAVMVGKEPALVCGGAGTGKTRVLASRIARLIESGVKPESILLLTFTSQACRQIICRASEMLNNDGAMKVRFGKLQSLIGSIFINHRDHMNLPPEASILDPPDSRYFLFTIRKRRGFDSSDTAYMRKERIYDIISRSKNCRIPIQEVVERYYGTSVQHAGHIESIYNAYEEAKNEGVLLDREDLTDHLIDVLKSNGRLRQTVQDKWRYVLIDDYQETNNAQRELIDIIAEGHKSIMVAGDENQSVESRWGANYGNLLSFPSRYPGARVFRLEENWRNSRGVVNFANNIVQNSKTGYKTVAHGESIPLSKPVFKTLANKRAEAKYIVDKIVGMNQKGRAYGDMSILYRVSNHADFIRTELEEAGIPYVVTGELRFMERGHIRNVVALLRVASNWHDLVSWDRLLTNLYGLGRVTADSLIESLLNNRGEIEISGYSDRRFYDELSELKQVVNKIANDGCGVPEKLMIIKHHYDSLFNSRRKISGYIRKMQKDDIDFLHRRAMGYNDLGAYLTDLELDPPSDKFIGKSSPPANDPESAGFLTLSTVSHAKGRQWDVVFIPHLLDGLFPAERSFHNFEELEQERRIFYVAVTRAAEHLFLTRPSCSSTWNKDFSLPSRYLAEIYEANQVNREDRCHV